MTLQVDAIAATSGPRAHPVWQPLPDRVPRAALPSSGQPPGFSFPAVVAVADLTGEGVWVDLAEHVTIAGPPRSGRTTALVELGRAAANGGTRVLARADDLIDDAEDLVDDFEAAALEPVARDGAAAVCVAIESTAATRAWSGWVNAVRRSRQLWWLRPEPALNLGVPVDIRAGVPLVAGRGILSTRDGVTLCQAAHG